MTAFARSDVAAVAISVDNGGCGLVHSRPVINGAPVKVFALACPRCEQALLNDPLWSHHPDLIPVTADEERAAEKLAKEGTGTMHKVAEALALGAGKILHEQEQEQVAQAAQNAQLAEAAEAERRAAAAERARAEQQARLREATRVAEAVVVTRTDPPVMVSPQTITKGVPDFPEEVHPSRKCQSCRRQLTRRAHATGRWPNDCLACRSKGSKAA